MADEDLRLLNVLQGFPPQDDEHSELRRAMSRSVADFLSGVDEELDIEGPADERFDETPETALQAAEVLPVPAARPKVTDSLVMGRIVAAVLQRAYEAHMEDLPLAISMDSPELRRDAGHPVTLQQLRGKLRSVSDMSEGVLKQRLIWVVAMHPRYSFMWNFVKKELFVIALDKDMESSIASSTPPKDLVDDFEQVLWRSIAAKARSDARDTAAAAGKAIACQIRPNRQPVMSISQFEVRTGILLKFQYGRNLRDTPRSDPRHRAKSPEPQQLPHELLVPKASRPPLYYVPEDVLEKSQTDHRIFLDWIFTNAPRFYGDVEDLATFAAAFADCNAWGGGFRSHEVEGLVAEELAASVQVRSLLDANLHPIQPIRDPWTVDGDGGERSAFNMVRPLMWDVQRHQNRRSEELVGHLQRLGPGAFGSVSVSQSLLTTTLPFAHQLLCVSRGQHRQLQFLPGPMMKLIMDLSADIDGETLRTGVAEFKNKAQAASSRAETPSMMPQWQTALPDDPIED
ncbi:unnamed protein product [Cladocopium goreaui]|uniref:Uncharacterized protein n=1 Tax=Cladocopium goreaui TaxID=2562237 RepID=A0A9P1G3G4_9DINO|nr:unnamed protein product [Cladocopium goreaui]